MVIIGLIGKKNSGKDTFADQLCSIYDFEKYSFAKPLKKVCRELFLLDEKQVNDPILKEKIDIRWNKSPRQLLQLIGTDIVRKYIDENFWIKHFNFYIDKNEHKNIIVSDVRFINELNEIKNKNGILIKINRNEINKNLNDNHISETELDNYNEYDFIINNNFNSLDEYVNHINYFIENNLEL